LKGEREMRHKEKLCSIAIASAAMVLFLILVSSTASASITEKWITNHGTASNPAIYGNTIVWQDERNGNSDIYIYDLSTKKQTHTTNLSNQTYPAIYGNKVVWADDRNGGSDIYMYDISTKKETRITNSGGAYWPSIYGNIIVWNDHRNPEDLSPFYDVYMYDISTKKETRIAGGFCYCYGGIYNNKIAIVDFGGDELYSGSDIYVYDISTKKLTQITTNGYNNVPDIYGNKIVRTHLYNQYNYPNKEYSNIFMYDLSTKKETQITTNKSDQAYPAIYGNTIVWQDNRNGNWDIYAYDLVTHQQIRTTDKSDQMDPVIYGNKVVWTDYRSGKPDIYMGTISYLPVAAFTASKISGNHPLNVQFIDKSSDAYYWSWDFGDKSTSTLQSPLHKYTKAGKYSVTLKVKNAAGSNTAKKTNYITVK
jgi:beta propeller repeat protein